MNRALLDAFIRERRSCLCVGLDPDIERLPEHLGQGVDAILPFNMAIIDAVADHCVAFKPNTAFYECYGVEGWKALEATIAYIRERYPRHLVIADAKRGDIGNTSTRYAKAFFEQMDCHGVTVAPYMGSDSVKPFLAFPDRWTILLALTSNQGSEDFQHHGEPELFQKVISTARTWGSDEQLMFVAGATRGQSLKSVREVAGSHYLLVPGVGAQGGSLEEVMNYSALPDGTGVLVNSSRGIIYAGQGADFHEQARLKAAELQEDMSAYF